MDLPQVTPNTLTERKGVLAVADRVNDLGLIWRETPMMDVGIDGQIEYVDENGRATGRLIAVQVKSGQSWFNDFGEFWKFYPADKHRFYWERFPVPVIVCLHSVENKTTYWTDVRHWLRSPESGNKKFVAIPKANILQDASKIDLFPSCGDGEVPYLELPDVLNYLIQGRSTNASFPITYFELFVFGLTNITRSLYFSFDLAMSLAEIRLAKVDSEFGLGVGEDEHNYLFNYVQFLASQHLVDFDYSDCLIDWYDRQMQPKLMGALTSRGRSLVAIINAMQIRFQKDGVLAASGLSTVAQEGLIFRYFTESEVAERWPLVNDFQVILEAQLPSNSENDKAP